MARRWIGTLLCALLIAVSTFDAYTEATQKNFSYTLNSKHLIFLSICWTISTMGFRRRERSIGHRAKKSREISCSAQKSGELDLCRRR